MNNSQIINELKAISQNIDISFPNDYATESGNLSSINNKLPSIGQQLSDDSVSVVLSSDHSNIGTNIKQLNGNTISTGSDFSDIGTQRVVIAIDNPTVSVEVDKIGIELISRNFGATDGGTQRTVLSNDYYSTVLQKNRLSLLSCRKSLLYFSSSVTGGSNTFNLGFNLTTSPLSAPILTSVVWGGGSLILIKEVQIMIRYSGAPPHNIGWGTNSTQLTTGIGIAYKQSSGGSEIIIVNDQSATTRYPSEAIKGNSGFLKYFHQDAQEIWDPAAGDVFSRWHFKYDDPLELDNTGSYYMRFGKEDISSTNIADFRVTLIYWS